LRQTVINFLNNKKDYAVLTGFAAGVYAFFRYLDTHFYVVDSLKHIVFFSTLFIIVPIVITSLCFFISKKVKAFSKYQKFILTFLNLSVFVVCIILITIGYNKRYLLLAIIAVFVLALILNKHLKKIIVFQLLLATMPILAFSGKIFKSLNESHDWLQQPDKITSAVFKKKPNIYVIQPDGYANFSELKKGYYNFDNSVFEDFLKENKFKLYNDFRSNYVPTVYSNSSLFGMSHHYYKAQSNNENETYNFRDIIVNNNPVLDILKANTYQTHLFLQEPYFILGNEAQGYNTCNINSSDVSFFSNGFDMNRTITSDFESQIKKNGNASHFYFLEQLQPWHISNNKSQDAQAKERKDYLKRLEDVNVWLKEIITLINKNDPNSLVIIIADHGGFVGYNYESESRTKTLDRDLIYSAFTSALAIKWPDNQASEYDMGLKSSINLFRVIFSYLAENHSFLNGLQSDDSYLLIEKGAPKGVYKVINEKNQVTFEKLKPN
jgi:hypothetical protein